MQELEPLPIRIIDRWSNMVVDGLMNDISDKTLLYMLATLKEVIIEENQK